MSTSPAGVAGVFDRAADTYDAVGVPWFGPIAQVLVDELAVRPGERVVDVGCGRGAALLRLAEATGPSGHVLGLDLAPRMVELTAADARARGLDHVELRVADARDPELPQEAYDVVCSCLVLFFLPDPAAALRTWTASLVPGGRLGVSTFGAQDSRWKAVDALFAPYLPQAMLDARASGTRGPFASDEGVEQLLRDAGLEDVRTVTADVEAVFSGPEQWLDFSWSHGQRAMWEAVPVEEHPDLRRRATAMLEQVAGPGRRLSFVQQVRYTLGRRP